MFYNHCSLRFLAQNKTVAIDLWVCAPLGFGFELEFSRQNFAGHLIRVYFTM